MKKTLLILLLLCLLLSACTPVPVAETTRAASAEPTLTAVPTERHTQAPTDIPTEPATTEPTATEPPVTDPAGYRAAGSRTSGGVLVHTDPSAYVPYGGSGAKYTRLREGPLDRFEPSEDYGAVYPYAVARDYFSWGPGYDSPAGAVYGFMDASGRVLTDGLYQEVSPMQSHNAATGESMPLSFWCVKQMGSVRNVERASDGVTWTRPEGSSLFGVVSMDGSFALDCVYCSVYSLETGIVCVESWAPTKFTLYSLDGTPMLTDGELLPEGGSDCYLDYGEGLYLLAVDQSTENSRYWFCDETGQRILGPYRYAEVFREGLAFVSLDGERFGFVDKTGAWDLEPVYLGGSGFRNGRAVVRAEGNTPVVINRTGRELLRGEPNSWLDVEEGFCYRVDKDEERSYYDLDGNLLHTGGAFWALDRNTYSFTDQSQTLLIQVTPQGRTELTINEYVVLGPGVCMVDGALREGYVTRFNNGDELIFVEPDLSGWRRLEMPARPTAGSFLCIAQVRDEVTGKSWSGFWTGTAWECLSESGERVTVPWRIDKPVVRNGLFYAETETASIYMTGDGELVFRFPIDAED